MLEAMESWASIVLPFLVANTLYAAVLSIPILAADAWLAIRANRLRSVLWAMILLRLVLPADLRAPWSLGPPGFGSNILTSEPRGAAVAFSGAPSAPTPGPEAPAHHTLAIALLVLWAGGVIATGATFLLRRRRLLRGAHKVAPAFVAHRVAHWSRQLGMRRAPAVFVTSSRPAMAIGWLPPRLLLPAATVAQCGDDLDAVIIHELEHLRCRHDQRLFVAHLIRAIYFFHPIARIALRRMTDAHERVCDRAVLDTGISRQRYARLLLATFTVPSTRLLAPSFAARTRRRIEQVLSGTLASEPHTLRMGGIAVMAALLTAVASSPPIESPQRLLRQDVVWQHPLPGATLSSGFGMRPHPETGEQVHHTGVDLVSPFDTPVLAAATGIVRAATTQYRNQPGRGTVIVLEHSSTVSSYYGHLNELFVRPGDRVTAGTPIGSVGVTGWSNGPHLHFEIWTAAIPVRPDSLISIGER
jgi:murein DD-endopeptidase MepM/ murein hydrolase activator NlpD